MTVPTRLLVAFVLVAVVLALPTGYATLRLGELQRLAVGERNQHATASLSMGRIEARLSRLDLQVRSYLASPTRTAASELDATLSDLTGQVSLLDSSGYEEAALTVEPVLRDLRKAVEEIRGLVTEERLEEATEAFGTVQALIGRARRQLTEGAVMVDRRAQADFLRAEQISSSARTGTLLALLASLIVAGLVGFWAADALVSPLRRLSLATAQVAGGDFESPQDLPYGRSDEIGDLSRSFRLMTQRLEELDRMKADFIGLATHDLKTPINVIMGYTELVEDELVGEVTEQQHEILHGIAEQCHAMTRLVSRLMDISRLEAGTYRLEMERIHLEDLMTGLVRAFELLADREGVDLATHMEDDLPAYVVVDVDVVRHEILGNLITNAIKFTPEGGEVALSVRRSDEYLVFRVSDTGPGIPPDHREHIFDKYYQADRSRRVGAGLGLAIVRELTEAHGGHVELVPPGDPGLGAVFELTLPIEPTEPTEPFESTEAPELAELTPGDVDSPG
ncbi:MAG: ATP-binding protein [Gemmatimonadota bacterium]